MSLASPPPVSLTVTEQTFLKPFEATPVITAEPISTAVINPLLETVATASSLLENETVVSLGLTV